MHGPSAVAMSIRGLRPVTTSSGTFDGTFEPSKWLCETMFGVVLPSSYDHVPQLHELIDFNTCGRLGKEEKKIFKIVLTGGPCGGKSSALSLIRDRLLGLGYR